MEGDIKARFWNEYFKYCNSRTFRAFTPGKCMRIVKGTSKCFIYAYCLWWWREMRVHVAWRGGRLLAEMQELWVRSSRVVQMFAICSYGFTVVRIKSKNKVISTSDRIIEISSRNCIRHRVQYILTKKIQKIQIQTKILFWSSLKNLLVPKYVHLFSYLFDISVLRQYSRFSKSPSLTSDGRRNK